MPRGSCPECGADVHVSEEIDKGEYTECDECGAELVVVGLDPVELDLREDYEDDEDDDYYDDDDEDE
ncbi:MAG TPA: hypothetical protein PLL06_02675 [Acidobacteriota bacterium]|nr:hypothetical protein [Acidobacteriota bacterium]HMW00176.1 hypothetical protein [Acidobacteriota bacterium]HMZ78578.1 hypothetical protein [Acidobacteriota bacterium]HNB70844.1 hypothetical protein [Acidobacteriota bacterium]HND17881.1 hypothetical protein [Acidobacteriota bacterium]